MPKGVVITALAFFNEVAISSNFSSLFSDANVWNEIEFQMIVNFFLFFSMEIINWCFVRMIFGLKVVFNEKYSKYWF